GVVHQHVDGAGLLFDGAHHGVDGALVEHARGKGPCAPSRLPQLANRVLGLLLRLQVIEGDRRALARKHPADCAPEPSGPACDKRDAPLEEPAAHVPCTTRSDLPAPFGARRANCATAVSGPFAAPRWNLLKPQAGL